MQMLIPENLKVRTIMEPEFLSVKQFAQKHSISEASVRWIRYRSIERVDVLGKKIPPNGFAPAFACVGRKVFVLPEAFMQCLQRRPMVEGARHEA